MKQRISFLDSLRGIAIILVVLYHIYGRGDGSMPFGKEYSFMPYIEYGYLGVQLFFLISGFVILMSLERSEKYLTFLYKRWIRLFPAMLIMTLIIYTTSSIFYERATGVPTILSIIPGLVFIEPEIIKGLLGVEFPILEGAFWSLYIEMRFYIIFGLLYFTLGRNKAIIVFFLMYLATFLWTPVIANFLMKWGIDMEKYKFINYYILNREYGWFIAGCIAYLYYKYKTKKLFIISFSLSLWCFLLLFRNNLNVGYAFVGFTILGAFYIPLISSKVSTLLSNRVFLFVGFISYPLYLIHENMIISMTVQMERAYKFIPDFLIPCIGLIPIVLVSYIVAKWGEPILRNKLDKLLTYKKE